MRYFLSGVFFWLNVWINAGAMEVPVERVLASSPPMGWNSFDSYGVYLHEQAAFDNLEAMAEKLKPHGYEYFVIDNGWFGEYALQEGRFFRRKSMRMMFGLMALVIFYRRRSIFLTG